jgi:hypothetical protein
MNKIGTVRFSGKSGNQYRFDAYPQETVFEEGFSGVYMITHRKPGKARPGFVHKRICIGQSDDLCQSLAKSGKVFSDRGANCFCVHAQNDEGIRQEIEQDLKPKAHPAADAS